MRIGIIAWGSLIWNPGTLELRGRFQPDGPHLPIEFSRISGDGRLTLVIDEPGGASCATFSAESAFQALDRAIENLRLREGMPSSNGVGFVNLAAGTESALAIARHPQAVATIKVWTAENDFDAAIWTALESNFHEPKKAGTPFTVDAAKSYLVPTIANR
jgi:hypothetical protein